MLHSHEARESGVGKVNTGKLSKPGSALNYHSPLTEGWGGSVLLFLLNVVVLYTVSFLKVSTKLLI